MATGAPTPDLSKLSDEELEKLTAPDQGDQIASAVAPAAATEEAASVGGAATGGSVDPTPDSPAAENASLSGGIPEPLTPAPDIDPVAEPVVDSGANTPNPFTRQMPVVPEPAAVTTPEPPAVVETTEEVAPPTPPVATTEPVPNAPEHQFTGSSVKVHIGIKGFDVFDHTFQVSTEPIVEIINRVAKSKLGCDLTLLDGLKIFVHGEEVPATSQAHTLGFDGEATIEVTYD